MKNLKIKSTKTKKLEERQREIERKSERDRKKERKREIEREIKRMQKEIFEWKHIGFWLQGPRDCGSSLAGEKNF